MSFDKLILKVTQAEDALEAHERRVAADLRQLKASWLAGWTPGRIVVVGAVSGFFFGRAEPLKAVARSGNAMQLITMLSGLFAGSSAQAAAGDAEQAAQTVDDVADRIVPEAASAAYAARGAATEQRARTCAESFEP